MTDTKISDDVVERAWDGFDIYRDIMGDKLALRAALTEAVKAEREAILALVEQAGAMEDAGYGHYLMNLRCAIRARGEV